MLDIVLECCRQFGWTIDHVLDMPVRKFWLVIESINRRNRQRSESIKNTPGGGIDEELLEEYE